jgi:polar amino acid transport system permease protein
VDLRWDILVGYAPLFLQGLGMTIALTAVALAAGLALGLVVGVVRSLHGVLAPPGRRARAWLVPLRAVAGAYVGFFRGTPLFVQILLVHFALMPTLVHPEHGLILRGEAASVFRQEHGAFFSGSLALSLNAGAYLAEIFRAGLTSIAAGQVEAAHALGLRHLQTLRLVVLPQAFRRMLPAFVNEAIALTKDSSLVSAIGLAELAMAARTVAGAYSRYWEPYLAISAVYLVLTLLLAQLARRLERPAHERRE